MIVKIIISSILLTATFSSGAQIMKVERKGVRPIVVTKTTKKNPSYSIEQFTGKWQEVSRVSRKSNSQVAFKDTLFYNFTGDNRVQSRDGVNMSLKGEAAIDDGNVLVAAADVFTIRSLTNRQAVLDDGEEYIHTLVKKRKFWYETLPDNSIEPETFITPVSINIAAINGKWKVYRREAKPGSWSNGEVLIRSFNITEDKGNNTASGEITFYKTEKLETLPCTIEINGDRIKIVTEKNSWDLNVYKADGKEFVFGNASLKYYAKPTL